MVESFIPGKKHKEDHVAYNLAGQHQDLDRAVIIMNYYIHFGRW